MKLLGDYHTHTIYSHGRGTIRENVEAAVKLGLKEIAICDHGPGHFLYGVNLRDISTMRQEIDLLNEEFKDKGIRVLLGIEANVIGYNGLIDLDKDIIEKLDILLLGFHYGVIPVSIKDKFNFLIINPLSKFIPFLRKKIIHLNTQALIKCINNYNIDFITHPGSKAKIDIKEVAKAAYKRGTALEINSHHSELSIESIEIALTEEVEFIINSDAHKPEDVGDVQEGINRAIKTKIPIERIRNISS